MADRKSGQSKTGFADGAKDIGPWGPVCVPRPRVNIPDHATSDEHAVKRERESILRRDYGHTPGGK
ncbi:hypothetical protein [Anaeromyxobacter diazotrophicus]|uniref:Uncharacterized protein n=1 Tax=Anaeromyxobacter diazotrophicus TaxID=2590199 RepID=A0A7I9VKL8_9BACT|nr:hypothetical protein [Anaeromyxobacter diazotrophicus]GEJ56925.1 hypothetical protein AMYX_16660 [Anaeromyxobacter diazotrophicus]